MARRIMAKEGFAPAEPSGEEEVLFITDSAAPA